MIIDLQMVSVHLWYKSAYGNNNNCQYFIEFAVMRTELYINALISSTVTIIETEIYDNLQLKMKLVLKLFDWLSVRCTTF